MIASRDIDVRNLPDYRISSMAPLWWGQFLLCIIEASTFAILIGVFFFVRLGTDSWPPPGTGPMPLTLPTIALVPLAVSCVGSYWASSAAERNSHFEMVCALLFNLIPGTIFVVLRILEWRQLHFNWASDIHGSYVWAVLFLHTLDTVADLIMTSVLLYLIMRGGYGPKQRLGVHVDSVLWYFIAAVWVPFYGIIYWGPRLLGSGR